jgi:ribonucleoside-diphosphate reductase alpha chain
MISAIFRRGGDVSFVVEELKAVFDPQGGQWMGGRYVPSLLAAIGGVIETHMIRTGFLAPPSRLEQGEEDSPARALTIGERSAGAAAGPGAGAGGAGGPGPAADGGRRRSCPRCNAQSLRRQEGCLICDNCGYSKCN